MIEGTIGFICEKDTSNCARVRELCVVGPRKSDPKLDGSQVKASGSYFHDLHPRKEMGYLSKEEMLTSNYIVYITAYITVHSNIDKFMVIFLFVETEKHVS